MESKKYELAIAPDAENDLDEIDSYMRNHFLSEQAAKNVMGSIKSSLATLMDFPEIGINASDRIGKEKVPAEYQELKMIIAGSYLIFYVIQEKVVQVYRVVYQKRDWVNLFKK